MNVVILGEAEADADGNREAISRSDLLTGYTAVDFDGLVSDGTDTNQGGYSEKAPDSTTEVTETNGVEFHNFLWLFKKTTSAGGSGDNDPRLISIFKLERADATTTETLDLTYAQIY